MAWYSIKSSSSVSNNSGRSINCWFIVSKDSTVRWTESNEEVLLRSKSTNLQFWRRESSSGKPPYTILVGFWKKRSGSIKEFVKSFLRNISIFKKLLHFSLGENARSMSSLWFCKEISSFAKDHFLCLISWITSGLMNLAANLFMKHSWASDSW